VKGKIIVADFFFTRCGTICPKMSVQMQQLQFKLDDDAFDDVLFLSHTVDPENDTPEVLDEYARKLQADTARWKFLTGAKADIYLQGSEGYLARARGGCDGQPDGSCTRSSSCSWTRTGTFAGTTTAPPWPKA
jgi:protein SCO1/2